MSGFSTEQKRVILWRDGGKCCMCGAPAEEANHRLNRGMGGPRRRAGIDLNGYPNGCALCHECNGRIESDAEYRRLALERGVKLLDGQDPRLESWLSPFYGIRVWSYPNGDLSFDPPADVLDLEIGVP